MGNKKQELSDTPCPVCGKMLPRHSRGKTFHAGEHGITLEELTVRLMGGRPKCGCGCGNEVQWVGGSIGFSSFLRGHMTSESRRDGIEKLKKTLQQHHWARGLNKETSESIKRGSLITSTKLREGFSLGKIKHWASGKTAEVDPRIADAAKKRSATLRGKSHWNYMSSDEVVERVCQALGDKFDIVSGIDTLTGRKNNTTHHLEIRCKSCSIVTSPSVYDIIRYDKKVCLSCRTEESSIPQKEIEDFVRSLVGSKRC